MTPALAEQAQVPQLTSISPLLEMGAYEALWAEPSATFKTIADKFREKPGALPSDFVAPHVAQEFAEHALNIAREGGVNRFGIRIHGAAEYPEKLRDSKHPVELLYYQGFWDFTETRCVSVVGTRHPSEMGLSRAKWIAKLLVDNDFTVVSGLATGIDTAAHTAAIKAGGRTIAVIGTPLSSYYPKDNSDLQRFIAKNWLLISQVPFVRYSHQNPRTNRVFFPERNVTMSALTEATIIVEAGETSGTLIQARAALHQGRKIFILNSCFDRKDLTWPKRFEEKGAIRVHDIDEILHHLNAGKAD